MAAADYDEWMRRGRLWQAQGRPVDALLAFRRAARLDPRAADALVEIGDAWWRLQRIPDAIEAWREAARLAPDDASAAEALAEALLATGALAEAAAAAERALTLTPGSARAAFIRAIAELALCNPDEIDSAARDIAAGDAAALLKQSPGLAARPALMAPLAQALDAFPDGAGSRANSGAALTPPLSPLLATILSVLAAIPDALSSAPPLLLALALESATGDPGSAAPLVAIARSRNYAPDDRDALRRIARAVARFDDGAAAELAAHFAAICAQAFAPPVPLTWPRRTAGARLRVVCVYGPSPLNAAPASAASRGARPLISALAALARDGFEITLAAYGGSTAPAAAVDFADLHTVWLREPADVDAAKRVAAIDADVLLDLTGMDLGVLPLLAQRPARAVWSVAGDGKPAAAAAGVDRVLPPSAVAAALAEARAGLRSDDDCACDAAALGRWWDGAVRAHRDGDLAGALEGYAKVEAAQPSFAPALLVTGIARREAGDAAGARARFERALAAAPDYAEARLAAAQAAATTGDAERAVALCEEGVAFAPADARMWRGLGHAMLARRDGAAAAVAFARALARAPGDAETHYNRGVALQMQRDVTRAMRAYQRALVLDPGMVAADFNLGVIFQEQGATDAAIAAYRTAITGDRANALARKNLGEVLQAAGRAGEYLANFRAFEANCPDALPLAVQALEACQMMGAFDELDRYLEGLSLGRFRAASDAELVDALEELQYLLLFFDVPQSMLLAFARDYDAAATRFYGAPLPRPILRRPGRLRIGYLSADLRDHVMGKMMWSALQHHDRDRFELFFYSTSAESGADAWTTRFRGLAAGFAAIDSLSERAAAARIAEDDLDLLVDLSTHTKGARPGVLALKPARVQVTHVASAGAVGLSAIDYKLTDAFCDPPSNQSFQIETLLPMEGCVYPYRHVAAAAAHPFRRDALGIAADTVVIGAFVTMWKLSRRCLALWREVLERVPRAKLAFSPNAAAQAGVYVRLCAAAGIAEDRLLFLPQGRDDAENRARYGLVDFVLDPMPFGGVNGTLEALDMGVPVVTLVGARHGERTSYSILANLGVAQTAAETAAGYVETAVRLVEDSAYAAGVRAAIRAGLARSTLTDMPAHARALERAYLTALAARAPDALAAAGSA